MKGKKNVLKRMRDALGGHRKVLILPHSDPDPDAIASACALSRLIEQKLKVKCRLAYRGIIGRAENIACVKVLNHSSNGDSRVTSPAGCPGVPV